MAEFRIYLTTEANTVVDLTIPDEVLAEALDGETFHPEDENHRTVVENLLWEGGDFDTPTLCHQCSGGRRFGQNMKLGDVWDVSEITQES